MLEKNVRKGIIKSCGLSHWNWIEIGLCRIVKVHRFQKWFALQLTLGLFYLTELTADTADRLRQQNKNFENNAALHRFLLVSPELWQHVRVSSSCHWCTRPLQSWCQSPLERPHSPPRVDRSAWQFPVREFSSDQITYWLMIHRKCATD